MTGITRNGDEAGDGDQKYKSQISESFPLHEVKGNGVGGEVQISEKLTATPLMDRKNRSNTERLV